MKSIPSVTSVAGLPAAVSSWRSRRAGEAHLIVCKATYRLAPGVLALAKPQDPLIVSDVFRDDEGSSLLSASDFAIQKRRADVVVIGSAFAPGGRPARRVVAYISVGELEKAVEVAADRHVDINGSIVDGPAFVTMPLSWERAAADETRNPVGRRAMQDSFGRMTLPNLQPPAFEPKGPDFTVPPVGLGPIAPHWPLRRIAVSGMALRPGPGGTSWPEAWVDHGVPDDGELTFFQIAPTDQQLDHLPTDGQLVLENLSPKSQTLGTRMPGHRARAFLAPSATEIELVCDTMVIDTDRELVTLTWRGSYFVTKVPESERVVIVLDARDKTTSPEEVRRLCGQTDGAPKYAGTPFTQGGTQSMSAAGTPLPRTPLQTFETAELPAIAGSTLGTARIGQTILGLSGLGGMDAPPSTRTMAAPIVQPGPMAAPIPITPPAIAPSALASPPVASPPLAPPPLAPPLSNGPSALAQSSIAQSSIAQPPISQSPIVMPPPMAQPPLGPQPLGGGAVARPAVVVPQPPPSQPAMVRQPMASQPMIANPPTSSTADMARSAKPPSYMQAHHDPAIVTVNAHDAKAALGGVASASNAASEKATTNKAVAQSLGIAPTKRVAQNGYFDLLWHSPQLADKLKALPEWAKIVQGDKKEFLNDKAREGRTNEEAERAVRRALARGAVLDSAGVHRAVLEAVDDDGVLVRPIVTVEGEVSLILDPLEQLAVSLSLSEPLAASDKKFKESHDAA
ncbi:MAG: DUF2169 domain-containing protein, partial [Polyangiaceae bacterium]|nr:DUF2169 domain-containing protein [Polyangiaceae bacterium]